MSGSLDMSFDSEENDGLCSAGLGKSPEQPAELCRENSEQEAAMSGSEKV